MGYRTIIQGSVVVLIFAYVALGPYSSIYQQALDSIKGPFETAFRAVKNALYDIYLLATNPTEWYARQQVVNARPEKPISFPKSLEVTQLDATPSSVPGGQPFVLTFVLKNEGDLPVKNVKVTASCNQWCDAPLPKEITEIDKSPFFLCVDYTLQNEVWCSKSCDQYLGVKQGSVVNIPTYTSNQCVDKCKAAEGDSSGLDKLFGGFGYAVGYVAGGATGAVGGALAGAGIGIADSVPEVLEGTVDHGIPGTAWNIVTETVVSGVVGGGARGAVGGAAGGADVGSAIGWALGAGTKTVCNTKDVKAFTQNISFNPAYQYEKGSADIVTLEPFVAKKFEGREAETRVAKVYLNVSFQHGTSSQLLTNVISQEERERLIKERRLEFKPVVAVTKVAPAKLSLNVGPQPLLAGKPVTLLVSVSNDRDDSRVILKRGTPIWIRMPRDIGTGLECSGSSISSKYNVVADSKYGERPILVDQYKDSDGPVVAELLKYRVEPAPPTDRIEILPYEFNTIFVFLCHFTAQDSQVIGTAKTGIITAELPSYEFIHTIKKDVPVTTPVGILFDPYESYCNKAGTQEACHARSKDDTRDVGTCYWDAIEGGLTSPGATVAGKVQRTFSNVCHSCGSEPTCGKFKTPVGCAEATERCSFPCKWTPGAKDPATLVDLEGRCEAVDVVSTKYKFAAFSGPIAERIIRQSKAMGFQLQDVPNILAIAQQESRLQQCKDSSTSCGGSNRDSVVVGDKGNSVGIFQLNRPSHPDWFDPQKNGCGGQTPYDLDCNIYLGVGYIRNLYNAHYTETKNYVCDNNAPYTGWQMVFRYYNGWNTDCSKGNVKYADDVGKRVTPVAIQYDSLISKIYKEPAMTVSLSTAQPKEGQIFTITATASATYDKMEVKILNQPPNAPNPIVVQEKNCITPTASCRLEWVAQLGSYSYAAKMWDESGKEIASETGTFTVLSSTAKTWQVDANFCASRAEKCTDGQGGCLDNSGCRGTMNEVKGGGQTESVTCTDVSSYGINGKICCYASWIDDPSGCVAKYKSAHPQT